MGTNLCGFYRSDYFVSSDSLISLWVSSLGSPRTLSAVPTCVIYLIEFYIVLKCAIQDMGTNLCGFYVMEFLRTEVTEEWDSHTSMAVREQYIHKFLLVPSIVTVNIHIDLLFLHRKSS